MALIIISILNHNHGYQLPPKTCRILWLPRAGNSDGGI
ncbi:hypothetical protein NT01EI_2176 [Edwardsiella ictaluri 93-146]|uniref:Uncharacterized protein n=1 Tax=Edwardsiella ictaluri (strain 93-146) TaxID=634503 RepID=C5BFS4_EDWI9|nr:hypothetical protein NT01EI_2176 [Edwardsiella ictaluri 93-146]